MSAPTRGTTASSSRKSSPSSNHLPPSPSLPALPFTPTKRILPSPYILTPRSNAVCAPIASDQSDTLSLTYPGTDNLVSTAKGNYNDRLLSYQCFRNESYALDPMEKSRADAFEEAKGKAVAEGRMK